MILNWKLGGTLAIALAVSPAFAENKADKKGYDYLALGDSISFGFDPTLFKPHGKPPRPKDFTGYPEILESVNEIREVINASCPGESSASFNSAGMDDNGCNSLGPEGQPPFKTSIGLHEEYKGTQLEFAIDELRRNKNIRLVTLSIGGNDLSLVQKKCTFPLPRGLDPSCVAGELGDATHLGPALIKYQFYLAQILREIRAGANYKGDLVLMTNYVPNNIDLFVKAVAGLNAVMRGVGSNFGVKIADGFTAFQIASLPNGGDPCAAGLLVRLPAPGPNGRCDIHPSAKGQKLLAATVLWAN